MNGMKDLKKRVGFICVCLIVHACNVPSWISVERSSPPYEYDFSAVPGSFSPAVLPVMIDERIQQPAYRTVLQPLVDSLNARLNGLDWITRATASTTPPLSAPILFFGTRESRDQSDPLAREGTRSASASVMVMSASSSTPEWRTNIGSRLAEVSADHVILITLGISDYYMEQSFFLESKVYLGTDYARPVTWVADPEEPIQVLHLVGAMFDRNGTLVRMAVEGLTASSTTGFARAQLNRALGSRSILRREDVQALASETRRDDISGAPLVLHVALDNLLARLTGQPRRIRRPGNQ